MAELPTTALSTVEQIYKSYENDLKRWGHREHLGASLIGDPCSRKIWYVFRWAKLVRFEGRMLRLFDTGNKEENRLIEDLRRVGVRVEAGAYDPVLKITQQFKIQDHGGHFGGSLDGIAKGIPEAPKSWHLLEFKTSNTKGFKKLQADGLRDAKPVHYAQMQVYMHYGKDLKRGLYLCVNKETDEIYMERIKYDATFAQGLIDKAEMIIKSDTPPQRMSDSPSWYQCKWCDYYEICHEGKPAEVNCRTCMHSTPNTSTGLWECVHHGWKDVPRDTQLTGCPQHIYNPAFLGSLDQVDADRYGVRYRLGDLDIYNSYRKEGINSKDLFDALQHPDETKRAGAIASTLAGAVDLVGREDKVNVES